MGSNWIFAVGNQSGKCKFLKKFQWCPICVRVKIALIGNTARSFFVNYIRILLRVGERIRARWWGPVRTPTTHFTSTSLPPYFTLKTAKTTVSFPLRIVTRVIWHCVVVIADSVTCLLVTEALVLAFININLTVYSCCPLITVASVWTRNINTRTTIARISWQ